MGLGFGGFRVQGCRVLGAYVGFQVARFSVLGSSLGLSGPQGGASGGFREPLKGSIEGYIAGMGERNPKP